MGLESVVVEDVVTEPMIDREKVFITWLFFMSINGPIRDKLR